MAGINRRGFLKIIGLAATSATVGCSADSGRRLIPYIIPAEDIIPGEATWYATTCRECPAGCGMLAKNRDGRIIKVEGNPDHPVNRGALCPRGQASLHGLYNPDRFPGPVQRRGNSFTGLSWEAARQLLADKLKELHGQGRGHRIAFIGGLQNGTLAELIDEWLAAFGSGPHLAYEPFAYEPLRQAGRIVFGEDAIPSYRIDQADFLISLGAGFLETWLSNVEYARQFAAFHQPEGNSKNFFVYVGPRQSMTGAGADLRIIVKPDEEWLVGVALLGALYEEARLGRLPLAAGLFRALDNTLADSARAREEADRVIDPDIANRLAQRFMAARRPLVLAAGLPHSGPHAAAAAVAANLLNLIKADSGLLAASPAAALARTAGAADMRQLIERMVNGDIDLLFIHDANPVFSLPASWEMRAALEEVKTIVSFSACADETTSLAHLILPTHTPLESWGDYTPRPGIAGFMQPTMGPMFDTMHPGDLLLETARLAGLKDVLPWLDFYGRLQDTWRRRWLSGPRDQPFQSYWNHVLQHGIDDRQPVEALPKGVSLAADFAYSFPAPQSVSRQADTYSLAIYPTVQFFDGRGANRPWMQELPDPVTQTTWGGWVELHPETAAALKVGKGDMLHLSTAHGAIAAPALPIFSVPPGTLALPIGQGHENYGRYASGKPANPLDLMAPLFDPDSGAFIVSTEVTAKRLGTSYAIAHTDGNFFQEGRDLVEVESFAAYRQAVAQGRAPSVDAPLPRGYDPHRDMYPAHEHKEYRWCMVVDLDRCIGCGACVVACYAENNVAVVGREQMLLGREMSWLRVQRYFSEEDKAIRYLPMLCQHCDAAPCESVCPIFAPQHSVDGLNNQVYNRCFGTRFCSQNDPYKVRRFNWFTFTRAVPLDWQLNPDVTVRQKGVMEKCSFCVQRIAAAKIIAKDRGRKVVDGDVTTACVQTCPTNALTFGNLLDPDSRVAQQIRDPRAYQVLRELNTKPAVIYLKRLTQEL
jgi:molybdopterin-containing oxidoreductase family iron-sulfur binding subunit